MARVNSAQHGGRECVGYSDCVEEDRLRLGELKVQCMMGARMYDQIPHADQITFV